MPVHTYNNGKPYNIAQGRAGDRVTIVDRKSTVHPIVRGRPNSDEFVRVAKQELTIRAYRQSTIKNYLSCWVIATSTQRRFTLGPPISRSAKPLAHWIGSFRNKQPTAAILETTRFTHFWSSQSHYHFWPILNQCNLFVVRAWILTGWPQLSTQLTKKNRKMGRGNFG